jgi:ABC-2 type transport system ATP-binding protein
VSFGLLGPNGAGKTTLIRMLVGLLRPRRGTVRILGEPTSARTVARIGYMPQLPALYGELSVSHNVDFFARMYGLRDGRRQRVEEVLRLVGLWERRRDSALHLSGGMRQRLSLACALVHQPPLLLLDEPTVGLDPELRATFWEHFDGLTAEGTTIIISSHTMDDAAHCGGLAFLRAGRVIARGSPAQLRQATGHEGATLEDAFLYFVRQG